MTSNVLSIGPRLIRPGSLPIVAGILATALLAAALGWAARDAQAGASAPRAFDGFRQVRMKTVQAQLDQVTGPYIVVMGDSHAERLYLPTLCGLPVVNAGMSGATVADVLALARQITPPRQAEALLLSVGTNDIWIKHRPESEQAVSGFKAGLAALSQRLGVWTKRRLLVAIPPVDDKEEAMFPRQAAGRYSGMLARACRPQGCLYRDLFGSALPARAFSDGVHLRDYARFIRSQEADLCRDLGLARP